MSGGKGGGGGSQPQYSSQTTSIPDWIQGPAQQAVQTAQQLSQRPYQPFSQDPTAQVAQQNADTTQAYQQIRNMQGGANAAFNQAQGIYGNLAQGANLETAGQINDLSNQLYGNYQQNVMAPAQGLLGGYLQGGPLTAQQVGANTQALMSPYTSSVIDPTNQMIQQQLHQNLQNIGAAANQAGAFGGSRQGVQEGVAQAQAAMQSGQYLGGLLNNQWNAALTPGYNIGQLGAQQGYSAASGLAGMGQTGFTNAQSAGQGMANTNLSAGMTATGQMPTLAMNQQNQAATDAGLMQAIGTAQQQQQQANINAGIGQFYEQQGWPVQNLDILLGALTGAPYGTTTQGYGTAPKATSNVGGEVLGGLTSAASIGASIATIV